MDPESHAASAEPRPLRRARHATADVRAEFAAHWNDQPFSLERWRSYKRLRRRLATAASQDELVQLAVGVQRGRAVERLNYRHQAAPRVRFAWSPVQVDRERRPAHRRRTVRVASRSADDPPGEPSRQRAWCG